MIPRLPLRLVNGDSVGKFQRELAERTTAAPAAGVRVDATLSLTIQLQADLYRKLEAKAAQSGQTAGDLIAQAITALAEE